MGYQKFLILWPWPWSLTYFLKTLTLLITFEQWVLKLWFFTRVFLVMRPFYGVPLGPLAISSLAFLFKNKNERFSHGNSKCLWNLDLLKNLRLKIARVRGQRSEISPSLSHSRSLSLAFSSLAFFKTSKFQTRLRFSCENLAFLFLNKKARLEIASGPNRTPYRALLREPDGRSPAETDIEAFPVATLNHFINLLMLIFYLNYDASQI